MCKTEASHANNCCHNQRIILDENLRAARTNGNDLRTAIVSEPRPEQR